MYFQCGAGKKSVLAVRGESPCFEQKSSIYKSDGITERVNNTNRSEKSSDTHILFLTAPFVLLYKY